MNEKSVKKLLLLFWMVGLFSFSMGQTRVITGVVTASDTKESLPLANIQIKGSEIGVMTDFNGAFRLDVGTPDAILVFSFVGYEPQEVSTQNQQLINIELQLKRSAIDEVVVIGYGKVKKSDLTGSVSSIKSKGFNQNHLDQPGTKFAGKSDRRSGHKYNRSTWSQPCSPHSGCGYF